MDNLNFNKCFILVGVLFVPFVLTAGTWHALRDREFYIETNGPSLTWDAARDFCETQDAKLAALISDEEHSFLSSRVVVTFEYWIGLRQRDQCSCHGVSQQDCTECRLSWRWYDNTQMTYYNWQGTEPNNPSLRCGIFRVTGWTDRTCTYSFYYICKRYLCDTIECINGECRVESDRPLCFCYPGYTGVNCAEDVNECEGEDLCLNSATCTNTIGSYQCLCEEGWEGKNCEKDIFECYSNPCENNGTCQDQLNDYLCSCAENFEGKNCEIEIIEQPKKDTGLLQNVNRGDLVISLCVGAILAAILIAVLTVLIVLEYRNRSSVSGSNEQATN